MRKRHYLLFAGLFFILLSIFSFFIWRDEIVTHCPNGCTGVITNYLGAFAPISICLAPCNSPVYPEVVVNIPNQKFILFVWIGNVFIILWVVISVIIFLINSVRRLMESQL